MNKITENPHNLPPFCFSVEVFNKSSVICIRYGEDGYLEFAHNAFTAEESRRIVDAINAQFGITPAQVKAMVHGSMFGWDTEGVNPAYYESKEPVVPWYVEKWYDEDIISAMESLNEDGHIDISEEDYKKYLPLLREHLINIFDDKSERNILLREAVADYVNHGK